MYLSLFSFTCPICLFPSQVQTPDKSVSPLCLSLSSFLLAFWVVAPSYPGSLSLIYPTPSFTQQGPGLALTHSPITIAHMHKFREGLPHWSPLA